MSKPDTPKKNIARNDNEKNELRQSILDAAREIVLEKNFGDLSIRKLANKIGYAPGTIYLYFKSRDEIIREICVGGFAELGEAVQKAAKKENEPRERLIALLKAYADFAVNNSETYYLSFIENPKFTEEIFRAAPLEKESGAGRQALTTLVNTLRELKEKGKISEEENENLLAEVFWTAIHGIVSLKLIYPAIPFNTLDDLVDKTIKTLLDGLEK